MKFVARNKFAWMKHAKPAGFDLRLRREVGRDFTCAFKQRAFRLTAKPQNSRQCPAAAVKTQKSTPFGVLLRFGGGGGNRTRVRKSLDTAFSECSRSFEIPLTHRRKAGYALR